MKTLIRNCFSFLLLCQIHTLQAQVPLHYLEQLTTTNGLSGNTTTDIVQGQNGFLWIGTTHGLNRYDGSDIKTYFATADSFSLVDNSISRLIRIDTYHIAAATEHGLSILDTRDNTFSNQYFNLDTDWNAYNNQLLFMEKDKLGNLWIGTPVSIYRLDKNLHLKKIFRSGYSLQDIGNTRIHYVYNIIPVSTGEVLIWLSTGLHIWNPAADTLIRVQKQSASKWSFLATASYNVCAQVYGRFLIYFNYAANKLVIFDEMTGHKTYLPLNRYEQNSILKNISELGDGWVALSFALKGMSLIRVQQANGMLKVLHGSTVYFPNRTFRNGLQDSEGNWWFTSFSNGLFKISPGKQLFTAKVLLDSKTKKASHFEIESFYPIGNKIYIASYGDGFYIWQPPTGKLTHHNAKFGPHSENRVWNFSRYSLDTLWLGTQQGLSWYNLKNEKMGRVKQDHPAVLDRVAITTQFKDSENMIWMGLGAGNGVCVYDEATNSFKVYPNTAGAYPFRYPVSIAEDRNSNLWFVSDASANLVFWNRKKNKFKKIIIPQFKGKTYLPTGKLYLDKKNNAIWYGVQGAGLVRYNIVTQKVKTYGKEQGLSTAWIYAIVKDNSGILWLATAQGISSFDPAKEIFVNYDNDEGLPTTLITSDFYYDEAKDIIYAGAPGKVIYFSPGRFKTDTPPLHALITGLKVNNKPVLLPKNHRIKLPWKNNDITLSFTAINLTDGKNNNYAYKLGGETAIWTEVGNQRLIRFASLNPGHYIFTIKAARKSDNWSPFTDQFQFTIRPPFVKTIWFYLLTVIFIGGLIYGWYRYRLANILHLEKMRSHISHDLHDDIGSRLTNISMMSRIARQKQHENRSNTEWLERIEQESEAVSQSMREIIWDIDPDNDSLVEALPRMLHFASGLLEAKNINVQASIPDMNGIKIDMEKRRDLFMIFKEAVHNIVRHSDAKQAFITVGKDHKIFWMKIMDDGKGFDVHSLAYKNGLHYMKQRAERHQWNLKVDSERDKGTKVVLEIKIT